MNIFNLNRFYMLMMNDLRNNAKTISIFSITLFIFLAPILDFLFGKDYAYFVILYFGGFIITSMAFNDLHDRVKAPMFLLLPCSNLERFLNKWLLTSVGYALGTLVLVSLLTLVENFSFFQTPLEIFQMQFWLTIGNYILLQSVVLLGAITFSKHSLIKTCFTIGCIFLALCLFSALLGYLAFFPNHMAQGAALLHMGLHYINTPVWILLTPIFLYLTYLRLTEYELR